ncbi:hypothetical protein C8J57DRAFT_1705742 [Mycena rebaudengoi]|nr:hypothetical protein C8J57DRAFT_1705742 [Mycena rebaudengoi]
MQIPQELVDAIVDKVAIFDVDGVLDIHSSKSALRACSLTARSFLPRSQLHLFATISCRRYSSDLTMFDALLAGSPHIGEHFVRYFTLQLQGHHFAQSHEKTVVVPGILRLLPCLTHLVLDFDDYADEGSPDADQCWVSQPSMLKTSLHATLSRSCLRCLCLTDLNFATVSELEALLSHGIGLKELILDHIGFESSTQRVSCPHEPCVFIESLTLDSIQNAADALVSSFSAVDIKHLHSLVLVSTPLLPLLKANAQTLQKVRIAFSNEIPFDPDVLAGNQSLRCIEVNDVDCDLAFSLQLFGPLSQLKALKTISLHLATDLDADNGWNVVDWTKLNALLAQAGAGLEDVFLSIYSPTGAAPDLALVKQRLPAVAGKISHKNKAFSRIYTFGPHA